MNENVSKLDNLSKFGQTYQSKVITCLLYDEKFLAQIYDILHENFFDSEANQWIVEKIKQYYKQYKLCPSLDFFKTQTESENNENYKNNIIKKLKEAYELQNENDLQFIKNNFIEFCINQNYKLAVYDSVEHIKSGDYDAIKSKFKGAFSAGQNRDLGFFLLQHPVKEVLFNVKRNVIPTNWEIINELTEGGIAPSETGELFIVVGAPGGGKTWSLCNAGVAALRAGKTVVHYSLELSRQMVSKRYYSLFTGIEAAKLRYNEDQIQKEISELAENKGQLIIKTYPPKRAKIETFESHLNSLKSIGVEPHMIIIDYADYVKPPKVQKEKRLEVANIYEELRGFSGDIGVPIWTGSQSNREGGKSDIIEGEHISEDYSKIMIGDFIFSISRKKEDNESKTARVYIIKNRFGADKIVFPANFNVHNGKLDIYDNESVLGKEINKKMNADRQVREKLKERWNNKKT